MRISTCVASRSAVHRPMAGAAGKDDDEDKGGAATAQAVEARKKFAEGNERYARGDYDGAIESFKAAIASDATLPGPYRNLGLAYRAQNRCADALPMYEKYLELKPRVSSPTACGARSICAAPSWARRRCRSGRNTRAAPTTRPRRRATCTSAPT